LATERIGAERVDQGQHGQNKVFGRLILDQRRELAKDNLLTVFGGRNDKQRRTVGVRSAIVKTEPWTKTLWTSLEQSITFRYSTRPLLNYVMNSS